MKIRAIRMLCIVIALFTVIGGFSLHAAEEVRETEIVSVTLSDDGTKLTVKATLTDGMLALCKGRPIYLFEFYPCDKNADLAKRAPVAYQLAAEELTYELDMTDADPQRRYSKYILATQQGTEYSLMGNIAYLDNPEVLAKGSVEIGEPASLVGVAVDEGDVSQKFSHTVLPVYVNELFADTADGSLRYEYGENVYYIDTEVLSRLDNRIKSLSENAEVYLQLLMSSPDESTATLTMSLYSGDEEGTYYAPNTEDPLGVRLWSSLVEFLCERYAVNGEYGKVSAFILGNNINVRDNYANGGDSAEEFCRRLECTVRITDTAIRSTCSGVGLYVGFSGDFSGSQEGVYPVRDVLAKVCVPEADFGIYLDVSTDTPAFWLEEGITADSATPDITPKNVDYFIEYMSGEDMLYDGQPRPVMLGYSTDGRTQDMQAASALCTLYRAMTVQGIRAVIYNECTDEEGQTNGLLSSDGMPKVAHGELCDAAEGDLSTVSDQIRALLGQEEYESLRDSVLSDLFVVRGALPVYNGNIPSEVDAAYIADFVDGNMYDFTTGIETATHGFTMDSSGKVLRLSGKRDTAGMSRAFTEYDLSGKTVLVLEVKALTDDPAAAFSVILDGKCGQEEVSLAATVRVSAGQWNELAFDISGIDTLSEMSVSASSSDGGNLSWYIKDITVFSGDPGAGDLAVRIAVTVLIAVLVLFIMLLATLIYMRSRRRPSPGDRYTVTRRAYAEKEVDPRPEPARKKPEMPKKEPTVPVMPKTESKTFVVPPKHTENVKRTTLSLGIEPISADTVIEIDKTKGE